MPWKLFPRARRRGANPRSTSITLAILLESLKALRASADAFPPLKSAVGGAMYICDLVEQVKSNKKEAKDLAKRIVELIELLSEIIDDPREIPEELAFSLERFNSILGEITDVMTKLTTRNLFPRIIEKSEHVAGLQRCKLRLDEARKDFQLASSIRVEKRLCALNESISENLVELHSTKDDISLQLAALHRTAQNTPSSISFFVGRPPTSGGEGYIITVQECMRQPTPT